MNINKPIIIQCQKCSEVIEVTIDIDCVSTCERQMGTEFQYEGIIEDVCPSCGNVLNLHVFACEYPIGAIEYSETTIEGADIIEDAEFSLFDESDFV